MFNDSWDLRLKIQCDVKDATCVLSYLCLYSKIRNNDLKYGSSQFSLLVIFLFTNYWTLTNTVASALDWIIDNMWLIMDGQAFYNQTQPYLPHRNLHTRIM